VYRKNNEAAKHQYKIQYLRKNIALKVKIKQVADIFNSDIIFTQGNSTASMPISRPTFSFNAFI